MIATPDQLILDLAQRPALGAEDFLISGSNRAAADMIDLWPNWPHASVVVAFTRSEQHLWQAIDTRNLIGQAQGILMAKYELTAERAFGVLRRYSQQQNRKLAAVAEQLATTRELPGLTGKES